MSQWNVSSRVVFALITALVVLIMEACGPSAPDAESAVPSTATPAAAAERPGLTPEAPVDVAATPAPSGEQTFKETATPPPGQTAVHGTQGSEPTAPPASETVPVTFTPTAMSVLNDPGAETESATPVTENTDPANSQSGSGLPIFVEMVQAPLSPDLSSGMPPADTASTGLFFYEPSSRLLLVQPSIQILPTTEVLVGLMSAQVPGRPYLPTELFQTPSSQAAPLSVIAIDVDSGTLTLAFAGQTFELQPDESRSFKQQGEGELAVVEVTTITNYGRLEAIDLLPADPGSR